MAANLGAALLAEIAAKTETAITPGKGVEEALALLATTFDAVVGTIRSALPTAPVTVETSADPATVRESLCHLKKLFKNDNGDAADFIIDVRPALSRVLTESEINSLASLMGDFDFGAALKSLSDISARLALKLE